MAETLNEILRFGRYSVAFGTDTISGWQRLTIQISQSIINNLTAPVLSRVSAAGASPLVLGLDWTAPGTDTLIGYYVQLLIDGNADFSSPEQNIIFPLDAQNLVLGFSNIGLATPAGLYNAEARILRDNDLGTVTATGFDIHGNQLTFSCDASAYSAAISDTITASTAIWTSTTGTKKSSGLTITGVPALILQGTLGNGALMDVAATIAGANKSQWEHTTTTLATDSNRAISFGRYNGTTDFSTANPRPGVSDSNGYTITYTPGSTAVTVFRTGATQIGSGVLGTAAALSDVWTDELDISGAPGSHVLNVYRNGTLVVNCPAQTLTGFNVAWAGVQSNEKLTTNFGASAFTHALNSGFAFYG